ncbi:hypothetical protein JTE90_026121 [Oedothorax gibbosus]|uniref:Protein kinase domain-containing protein n=1 Tax=Oedothorax gibbosus TaxID=931172 RepID=A0AAV6V139_9ARAC|nr:hypothetical protein JTE90_026121 [Oedothorax gibbosus]
MSKIPFDKLVEKRKKSSSHSEENSKASKKSSSEELRDHGFKVGKVLGEGSYCKVRKATYKTQEIAVKVINRAHLSTDFLTKFLPREIEVLSKVKHENIIKVYKIFNYKDRVYIFMELAQNDLLNYVKERDRIPEKEARNLFRQIVSALKYLHSINVAHRDLKCENIMITENKEIKLIDLGFCRKTVNSSGRRILSQTYCGSHAYAAPEVLRGTPYNPMIYDVWSLGCVLYIMVTGRMPFDDSNVRKLVQYQLKKKFKFPRGVELSAEVKILIKSMLEPDVTKRISVDRVENSAWLKLEDSLDPSEDEETKSKESQNSREQ